MVAFMFSLNNLVKWLRKVFKVEQPGPLGFGEWDRWHEYLKRTRPVAYFFTETIPDWILDRRQDIDELRDKIVYRFVQQTHLIDTGLEKGKYHQYHEQALYGIFKMIIDYVEVELASQFFLDSFFDGVEPPVKRPAQWKLESRIVKWRSPEAGLAYLTQADSDYDRETLALYNWFKHERPKRNHQENLVGLHHFWETAQVIYGPSWMFNDCAHRDIHKDDNEMQRRLAARLEELQSEHDAEDEQMLIRAIKHIKDMY